MLMLMLMLMLIDAGAQAQACAEGGHQGDVREGVEGGGEARVEGGEGLAREGSQGLDLSQDRWPTGMARRRHAQRQQKKTLDVASPTTRRRQ